MRTDLLYSLRLLRKDRTFTLVVAFTLALGIGASTALFTIVRNVLIRPLPTPDADRVVLVYNSYPKAGIDYVGTAASDYADRLASVDALGEQALLDFQNPTVDIPGSTPERVHAMRSTASLFQLVRTPLLTGRAFAPDEDEPGGANVVVLSAGVAQQLFGAGSAIGKSVRIDGVPHEVVGVTPAAFSFIDPDVRIWLPLRLAPRQKEQHDHRNNFIYVARLQDGATLEQAQSQIDALNAANLDRFPESRQVVLDTGFRSTAVRLQDDLVRKIRAALRLLWAGGLFVLLIASVNVASLVLARSRARLKEFATRQALGASRWRILQQLAIEHGLLVLCSSALGILLALSTLNLVTRFGALGISHLARGTEISIDGVVVAYTVALAVVITAALSACPVFAGLTRDSVSALRDAARLTTSSHSRRAGRVLVVVQIAAALVLVDGAGLLLASFQRVLSVDPGFASEGTLTASINLPAARYGDDASLRRLTDRVVSTVQAVPGVVAAGATSTIPFGTEHGMGLLMAEGFRPRNNEPLLGSYRVSVTPGYFQAMRAKLVRGRFFDERDGAGAPKTIIVDSVLAQRYWPDRDPIGRRTFFPTNPRDPYTIGPATDLFTVVGVVSELKLHGLVEGVGAMGAFYLPYAQEPVRTVTVALQTAVDPLALAAPLRNAIAQVDRELAVFDVQSMAARTEQSLTPRRTPMLIASAFGIAALILAATGLYGVLAYLVAQRTKEIGIRIALGSTARNVFTLVLREGLLLVSGGFLLGGIGVLLLGRAIQSQLFEVQPSNPVVLAVTLGVLAVATIAASLIPARRAAHIDPVVALSE